MLPTRAFLWLLVAALAAGLCVAPLHAASPALDEQHPAVQKARLYAQAIVAREWDRCAAMLLPAALERRQRDALAGLQAADAERQAATLRFFGVGSAEELARLSPAEFYVAERTATFRPVNESADALAHQLMTLRTELLSAAAEEDGRFVHALFRTHRETGKMRVHELMLVSVLQDDTDPARWFIVPDSLVPSVEMLAPAASK